MKKFFAAAILCTALSTSAAHAADVLADAAYDWSGFYSGIQLGYSELDGTYFQDPAGNFDIKDSTIRFGSLSGYNFQSDNIVLGLESDTTFGTFSDITPLARFKVGIESTVRARVGVAMDRVLPFVSAGVALADANARRGGIGKESNYQLGFAAGAGIEFAASDRIRLRAEYLYENYGKQKYDIGAFNDSAKWDQHVVRAAAIWAW